METEERPSRWERLRRRLREAGRAAARTQAAVLFTLAYVLVIGPASMVGRLFGADLLSRRRAAKTGWLERPARAARESLDGAG